MITQASTSTQHPINHPRHSFSSASLLHPTANGSGTTTAAADGGAGTSWTGSFIGRFCGAFSPAKKRPSPEKKPTLAHVSDRPPSKLDLGDNALGAAHLRRGEEDYFGRVFRHLDEDGDGKISPSEIRSYMRTVGEELSAEDVAAVVESTDSDGDGLLGFDDFVKLVEVEGEEERTRDLREAFGMYASTTEEVEDGCMCITPKSLRRMLSRLGERKSMEECRVMIQRFDLNGDGVLSFDEFRFMML